MLLIMCELAIRSESDVMDTYMFEHTWIVMYSQVGRQCQH